jgi:hypothetical protein
LTLSSAKRLSAFACLRNVFARFERPQKQRWCAIQKALIRSVVHLSGFLQLFSYLFLPTTANQTAQKGQKQ